VKKLIVTLSIIGTICIILGVLWLIYGKIEVKLIGNEKILATYNEEYHDPGFIITKNDKEMAKDSYEVVMNNDIDITKLGEYHLSYDIKYRLRSFHLDRIVKVVDDVKPEIKVESESITRDYCSKKDKDKLEYTIIDNYDGDITDKATVEEIDDNYVINVSDTNGNENTLSVPIVLTEKPKDVFKLNGNSTVYVVKNNKYSDSGVTYTDGLAIR